jgi:hypothetical protein
MKGDIKIAVVAGIHYMDKSLLKDNQNTEYLKNSANRALAEFSQEIFQQLIDELINIHKPEVVLIPGDLTFEGERVSHKGVVAMLGQLTSANIKVYVIPGSRDIMNSLACIYDFNNTVTPLNNPYTLTDFMADYAAFGYGNTTNIVANDPTTKSYVVEILHPLLGNKGLRVIAINTMDFSALAKGKREGVIDLNLMTWIKSQLNDPNYIYLGIMYHNLIEHYPHESTMAGNKYNIVNNWEQTAEGVVSAGLHFVFTEGHVNDITLRKDEKWLKVFETQFKFPKFKLPIVYDIANGSLVSYPSPYRIVEVNTSQGEIYIDTKRVKSIKAPLFESYSKLLITHIVEQRFKTTFIDPIYDLTDPIKREAVLPVYIKVFIAHLEGDESITPALNQDLNDLVNNYGINSEVINHLKGLLTDYAPADNQLMVSVP